MTYRLRFNSFGVIVQRIHTCYLSHLSVSLCNIATRQLIEIESCSNPLKAVESLLL